MKVWKSKDLFLLTTFKENKERKLRSKKLGKNILKIWHNFFCSKDNKSEKEINASYYWLEKGEGNRYLKRREHPWILTKINLNEDNFNKENLINENAIYKETQKSECWTREIIL